MQEGACPRKWASSMTWCQPFAQEKCLIRTCRSSNATASAPSTSSWKAVGARDPSPRSTIDIDFWEKKNFHSLTCCIMYVKEKILTAICLPIHPNILTSDGSHPKGRQIHRFWWTVLEVSEILTALCSINRLSLTLSLSHILHCLPPPIVCGLFLQANSNCRLKLPSTMGFPMYPSAQAWVQFLIFSIQRRPRWQGRTRYHNQ